jgi:outer membrane protein assembly factor BamB
VKALLITAAAVAVATATAWSQPGPVRVYSNPRPPVREVLQRLNLTLAWSTRLKTDGARDGLQSAQLAPTPTGMQLLVQTLRGEVILLNADNGDTLWRIQVGPLYWPSQTPAFNSENVFVTRRDQIFVLDRGTGKHVLWGLEPDVKLPVWGMTLEGVPSAGLAADEDQVYVCFDSRVSAFYVPEFRKIYQLQLREETEEAIRRRPSPPLRREWTEVLVPQVFYQTPLVTGEFLVLTATDGTSLALNKFEGVESGRYQVEKKVSAQTAQYHDMAYVASEDAQLYAFDTFRRRLTWRFPAPNPILRAVHVTDRDVYLSPNRTGLYRIDRIQGVERWLNRDAERFLATNYKFLYALNPHGQLLVLDWERGTTLAQYGSTRDWTVPIPNELTDRIFLAAHDGSIMCLHHRDHATPLRIKTPPEAAKVKGPPKKKGGPKGDGKKGGAMKGAALGGPSGLAWIGSAQGREGSTQSSGGSTQYPLGRMPGREAPWGREPEEARLLFARLTPGGRR